MIPNIKITKLDAARRQLETAVMLYFNDACPVSIHTLVCAAHGILSDLKKKYDGSPMIVSDFLVRKGKKKEFNKMIREAKNHFKHADRNPEAIINFNPRINEHFLFDACENYQYLTSEKKQYFIIYRGWFAYKHPDICCYSEERREMIERLFRKDYGENKKEYFSEMLAVSGLLT